LGRVYNPDSAGKERSRLSRSVVLSIRQLMKQAEPDATSRDLAAFIALALIEISSTIDSSVTAWEKRGYWVKADRFRMEWAWTEKYGKIMRQAVIDENWADIAMTAAQIAQKLMSIEVPERHRLGEPWVGAWKTLRNENSSKVG
jgi:hypothetical protein